MNRVFSGIQPSGVPHLGNYFGAIAQWIKISEQRCIELNSRSPKKSVPTDVPIYCVVDVHAYTSSDLQLGKQLYQNILSTTASLLALGLDPNKSILFKQSDILEHFYLDNVLDKFVTHQQLRHMTQFKDKSSRATNKSRPIPNGLLNYPVLQAADIMLYRANLVPVGEDQIQHIELTRDIVRKFNSYTGEELFPEPKPVFISDKYSYAHFAGDAANANANATPTPTITTPATKTTSSSPINTSTNATKTRAANNNANYAINLNTSTADLPKTTFEADIITHTSEDEQYYPIKSACSRIKSLRSPDKKMSKSDPDQRSYIQLIDEPDVILDKCKKALTDSISHVYYDPEKRPGVSNLLIIYHLITGESLENLTIQFRSLDTAQFKLRLADVIIEKFKGVREEYKRLIRDRSHLESLLSSGRSKAQPIATETVLRVKQLLGSEYSDGSK